LGLQRDLWTAEHELVGLVRTSGVAGEKMAGELLTWLGVVSVLLLAWTIYVTAPHDDDEERTERVSDD